MKVCRTSCLQNRNKIDDVTTGPLSFILCFWVQSPTFDELFTFSGIKLKSGEWFNSETLISYFMSILSNKMNSTKIMGFMSCIINFNRLSFNKCCHGNIVDDILRYINKS